MSPVQADKLRTMLFLDDDDQKILQFQKHAPALCNRLITASSTQQAASVLRLVPLHSVVSTVHLKNESVFDFLRTVKQSPTYSHIPFILLALQPSTLTETINETLKTSAHALGADYFLLMQDFELATLKSTLENCFAKVEKDGSSSSKQVTVFPFKKNETSGE